MFWVEKRKPVHNADEAPEMLTYVVSFHGFSDSLIHEVIIKEKTAPAAIRRAIEEFDMEKYIIHKITVRVPAHQP